MIARTSTLSMNKLVTNQLLSVQNKYNTLQQQILTNTKVSKASDDPAAASKIALTKSQLNEYTMYSRSITSANLQLNSMESSLAQVTSRMQRANELITEASNEISTLESIKPIKSELEELLKTIVTLSNAQVDGQYIFSGANTTTPAYKMDDNGNVIYQGSNTNANGTTRKLEISDGVYVPLNQAGDNIFGQYKVTKDGAGNDVVTSSGIIGSLKTAIKAMEGVPKDPTDPTSELVVDYDTIREQIDVIKNEINEVSTVRAQFGSYAQRIEMTQNSIDENKIIAEERRAGLQDIDIVEALSQLAQQQYALQASMQITSQMLSNSLLNYM